MSDEDETVVYRTVREPLPDLRDERGRRVAKRWGTDRVTPERWRTLEPECKPGRITAAGSVRRGPVIREKPQARAASTDPRQRRYDYASDIPKTRGTWALSSLETNMNGGRSRGKRVRAQCQGQCGGSVRDFGIGEWRALTGDVTCLKCACAKNRANNSAVITRARGVDKAVTSSNGHRGLS